MNDESPAGRGSRSRRPGGMQFQGSAGAGLPRRPVLIVTVPLEGEPRVEFVADRLEDELRLRAWLRARPIALRDFGPAVLELLKRRDRDDARRAA